MNENGKAGFLDRTLNNLRNAWQAIAGSAYDESTASLRPELPEADTAALLKQMHACLDSRGGEVSARARAAALGRAYLALDATGRERFLELLASEFDVDHAAVDRAVDALRGARDADARQASENALRAALAPPRIELATRFNALPDGVKFLVDMRAELMRIGGANPRLRALEHDLKSLLSTWFDVDFLELRRITWESASAALLEKLIAYEAVHAIPGLGRSQGPARFGPPLLRLFPPADAGRAVDLRRGGARPRHGRKHPVASRRDRARRGHGPRGHGRLLLHSPTPSGGSTGSI